MKIRFSPRFAEFLLRSQAAVTPEYDPGIAPVIADLRQAKRRKDGSAIIELTSPAQVDAVLDYAETLREVAADNVGAYADRDDLLDALADLNTARAVLRAIHKERSNS